VALDWRSGDDRQDPATDSGPLRALHPSGLTDTGATVVGAAVPAHRHAHPEACRSTGQHPHTAANTVRAAQDELLLRINQEQYRQRLRAGLGASLCPGPLGGVQLDLANPHEFRRHLDAFVGGAELHRLF
jgi:hypothetical protein